MITVECKKFFFDRKAVIDAVGRPKASRLSKAGAFVRTRARSSIRPGGKGNKISSPGQPPRYHTKSYPNLRTILFAWDPRSQSVVIGPIGFNAVSAFGGRLQAGAVPSLLEKGGSQGLAERQMRDGSWQRADLRSRRRLAGQNIRVRQASYAARPFMGPALDEERPKFPDLWKNSVVRTA